MLPNFMQNGFFFKTLKRIFQQSSKSWPENQETKMLTAACRGMFSTALKCSLPPLKLFLAVWKVDKLFTRI